SENAVRRPCSPLRRQPAGGEILLPKRGDGRGGRRVVPAAFGGRRGSPLSILLLLPRLPTSCKGGRKDLRVKRFPGPARGAGGRGGRYAGPGPGERLGRAGVYGSWCVRLFLAGHDVFGRKAQWDRGLGHLGVVTPPFFSDK